MAADEPNFRYSRVAPRQPSQVLCHNAPTGRNGLMSPVLSVHAEQTMTVREQQEYSALRATIRERGTARICLLAAGMAAWGAIAVATAAVASSPVATLLPLVVLAAVFEAIFALHIGVERIGRYLQVFHETTV